MPADTESRALSHRIVEFLGGLTPVYAPASVRGEACARSLTDGTLILPLVDPLIADPDAQDRVLVRWRGDYSWDSIELGAYMVSLAAARYAEFQVTAGLAKRKDLVLKQLCAQYAELTGDRCRMGLSPAGAAFPSVVAA